MGLIFGALGIGLVISAIMLGGRLAHFIDLPSIAIVGGITVFLTFAYHGASKSLKAFF